MSDYNLVNIRTLLTEGFTDRELRRLCFDLPGFRPVYDSLAANTGKAEIIDRLLEDADRSLQLPRLLALAKERNPARYEAHRPYYSRAALAAELAGVETAIAEQEKLRGKLSDVLLAAALAELQARRSVLQAQLAGSGAIAQGEGAKAVGQGGVLAGGPVGGDIVTGTKITTVYQAAPGPDPAALRAAYLNHVFETTGRLSLAGVDPKAATNEAEARLSLGAVYTALLTLGQENVDPQSARGGPIGRVVRIRSALAQLDEQPRLVLLGDPGSGKSTFVNFVAMCLAGEATNQSRANLARLTAPLPDEKGQDEKQRQPWGHGRLLPVRVILRDFAARGLPEAGQKATAKHLWDFIAAELEAAGLADYAPHLREELLQKGGLLLLDGLDEVPEAQQRRLQLRETVEDFAAAYRRCRLLVTGRTYAYQKQAWRLPGFAEAVLAPFSRGQIIRFVEHWYGHIAELRGLHPDDAQGRAETLKRAIFSSDRLSGLAERPLLLTLMASLHAWRGGSLPEKREELYNDTVDLLLDWWESPKTVRTKQGEVKILQPSLAEWLKVDRARVRALLNETAYEAHAGQAELTGTADVDEGRLVGGLMRLSQNPEATANPALLIHYLSQRAGLLLPRGVGVYTFPHRTFQEYLAACYLTDHDYPDRVAELARQEPNRWREVALLAGAKAARGSAFAVWALVDALCYAGPGPGAAPPADSWGALLAGQALLETANLEGVSERNRPKVERVRDWLAHVLKKGDLPVVDRALAGRILGWLGDPREGVLSLPPLLTPVIGGKFLYSEEKRTQETGPFQAGVYPVTNAQFAPFIAAGGYEQTGWWSQEGWQAKQEQSWTEPLYWENARWNHPNHPVVGVSWYEAEAFCNWLGHTCGQKYRLPTEVEWERLARGQDGREYPWGNDWQADRANTSESGIGQTTAVGLFPGGISPAGAYDCAGNVSEWCADWYDKEQRFRVRRDGAWGSGQYLARCAVRYFSQPYFRLYNIGFRLACQVTP